VTQALVSCHITTSTTPSSRLYCHHNYPILYHPPLISLDSGELQWTPVDSSGLLWNTHKNDSGLTNVSPEFTGVHWSSPESTELHYILTKLYIYCAIMTNHSRHCHIQKKKNYFYLFVLNQKKIYWPSQSSFFQKS